VNDTYAATTVGESATPGVTQSIATPTITPTTVDEYEDDEEYEDDVKGKGGLFGNIRRWFDDAFRNPDEEDDDEM
jgi:hypothetical protein